MFVVIVKNKAAHGTALYRSLKIGKFAKEPLCTVPGYENQKTDNSSVPFRHGDSHSTVLYLFLNMTRRFQETVLYRTWEVSV